MSDIPASDIPAWVQAIGSVVAIGVAVYVPWKQHKRELEQAEKVDKLKAKALANAIYMPFLELRGKAAGAQANLTANYDLYVSLGQYNKIERVKIRVPNALERHISEMWILGENVSIALLQAISIARTYDEMIDKVIRDLNERAVSPDDAIANRANVTPNIESVISLCDEVDINIRPMIGN